MTEQELRSILSRNIKRYRHSRNFSQADLAEKLDISVNFLCNIENGNRGISFETIAKFVSALNIEPYELFKTETSMPSNAPLIVNKCLDEAVAAVTEALGQVQSYYSSQPEASHEDRDEPESMKAMAAKKDMKARFEKLVGRAIDELFGGE